jgi:pimeloyl-ACP methyl ester carboxylesterase
VLPGGDHGVGGARAAEASEADALGWIIHRVILGADAAGVADVAYLEQELGEEVDDIKALHQGGEQHWAALIQQTASMWLSYDGIPAERISAIDQPVLVVAGDRDDIIPLDLTVSLYRQLPHAELAIGPAADHITPLTTRGFLFAALIRDFAQRHTHDLTRP